ncbi:PAS domain-containing sensor histidine kinase [Dactylosporangium sp. NPDC000244]|uniref:PAS domain-containing sensor histidine kinase n=1 Tax=Dactylosporangium sp. NPDC000244 TaxID=3154365 RepID=UPI00332A9B3A
MNGNIARDDAGSALLLEVLQRAQLAVWIADSAEQGYAIREWNAGAESLYGYTRDEALGRNYVELFVNRAERAETRDSHQRIVEEGEEFGWNFAADDISKDGTIHTVLGNAFRIWDANARRYVYAEVGIDISDFEQMSRQLNRSRQLAILTAGGARQQLKIVRGIQQLNEAIASMSRPDERGLERVVKAVRSGVHDMLLSDPLCRIWLFDDAETPRLAPGYDELPGAPRVAEAEIIAKTVSSEALEMVCDHRPVIEAGDDVYHSVVASPLHIGSELRGILIMFFRAEEPLTGDDKELLAPFSSYAAVALVMAALAREQQRRRYEDTERIRHAIIQSVLHTVGNEAGLAKLAVDSLSDELRSHQELPAPVYSQLEQVRASVDRLGQIMTELIHLNVNISEQSRLNLAEAVRVVTRLIEQNHYERVVVTHDIDPGIWIEASEYLLREALNNLVQNAVQAMIEADWGGELRLTAETVERNWNGRVRTIVMLDIEDSGPGVQPGFRQRIWESGFTTRGDGHGHGLYYTRGLVGMLGGAVELVEAPSSLGGASFRLFLVGAEPGR